MSKNPIKFLKIRLVTFYGSFPEKMKKMAKNA